MTCVWFLSLMIIRKNRILLLILFVLIALAIAPYFKLWLGQQFDFVLAVVVASAFFLEFQEFLIVLFFSLAFLVWEPVFDFSLLILILLPIVAFFIKDYLPFKQWLNFFIDLLLIFLAFYLLDGRSFLIGRPLIFALDFIISFLFGSLVFFVLYYLDSSR